MANVLSLNGGLQEHSVGLFEEAFEVLQPLSSNSSVDNSVIAAERHFHGGHLSVSEKKKLK